MQKTGAQSLGQQKPSAISPAFSGSMGFAKAVVTSSSDDNKMVVNLFILMPFGKTWSANVSFMAYVSKFL